MGYLPVNVPLVGFLSCLSGHQTTRGPLARCRANCPSNPVIMRSVNSFCPPQTIPNWSKPGCCSFGSGVVGTKNSNTLPYGAPSSYPPTRKTIGGPLWGHLRCLPLTHEETAKFGCEVLNRKASAACLCQFCFKFWKITMGGSGTALANGPCPISHGSYVCLSIHPKQFCRFIVVCGQNLLRDGFLIHS